MKKVILLSSLLVITGSAIMAQKTSFGIKAGIQQSAVNEKIDEGDVTLKLEGPRAGFIIGGTADLQLSNNFSVQPNLLFNYRPGNLVFIEAGKLNIMSIDVPINLLYRTNGFYIGAGPNISYGLSAKFKSYDDDTEEINLYEKIEDEDAPLKRFEIGANALMGYQFPSGLTLTANYTRNFNNILNGDVDEIVMNSKQFGISIGYVFNAKAKK